MLSEEQTYSEYILCVDRDTLEDHENTIRYFLQKQPESYINFWSEDEIIQLIYHGFFIPWIYYDENDVPLGLALTTIERYSSTIQSLKVEFLSCEKFFKIIKGLAILEHKAEQLGFTYVEAMAHPVIAWYLQKKMGYSSPGIHVLKNVSKVRRH